MLVSTPIVTRGEVFNLRIGVDACILKKGDMRRYEIEGHKIVIGRTDSGNYFAVQAECPHKGGPLEKGQLEGDVLICPWHRYEFNVLTGRLLKITVGPRYGRWREAADLKTYGIEKVPDGDLELLVPK